MQKFDSDRIYTAFAYELKSFSADIKILMDYYSKNKKSKNEILKESLVDTAEVIKDSYQNLLDRNQRLTIIKDKSDILLDNSYQMKESVKLILIK